MQVAHVSVIVTDLDRAIAFYHTTLGLPLQYMSPAHGYASSTRGGARFGIAVAGSASGYARVRAGAMVRVVVPRMI